MTEELTRTLDRRISALETYTAVDEVHRSNVDLRLHAMEDMLRWLVRLVMGALIMGITGYVLAGGLMFTPDAGQPAAWAGRILK